MHYLLWEPSVSEWSNESFVLLQSEAPEELVRKFTGDYFFMHQILLISKDVITFDDKEIDVQSFTEDEIKAWYYFKQVKEETEKKQKQEKFDYLTPWRTKSEEAQQALKDLDEEERQTIFKYFEPEKVSKELITAMLKMGYEKYKPKNGKTRFRSIHHEELRKEFETRRLTLKEVAKKDIEMLLQASKAYDETHEIKIFEPIKRYQRL